MPAVRLLTPSDWHVFKTVRLAALAADPQAFGASHAKESAISDVEWRERLSAPGTAVFIAAEGAAAAGMAGLSCDHDRPEKAVFWGLWLAPGHRGCGLAAHLQAAALDWATHHGINVLRLSHRASNDASRRFAVTQGYALTETQGAYAWPDGVTEPRLIYELKIPAHVTRPQA
jgi:RimJ/RimL family protein N-acetyltransferase